MAKTGPVRIGLIGLGRAGWGMHCPELKGREDKFKIVAVCDSIPGRLERAKEAYGCATYAEVKDLMADPSIELIDIASRSCDHYTHALAALKTGKHVLLEKPMCTTYAEAQKIVRAAKTAKGKLFIRHNRRYEPCFQHVREIIDSGLLGKVFEVKLRRLGFSRRDDWQTLKKFGGGQLLNWGPHIIDHGLQLLESQLMSLWSHLSLIAAAGDAEDHLKIVMVGENDRVIDLEISGGSAMFEPEYIVLGTKGGLSATGDLITLRYLDPKVKLAPRKADPGTPGESFGRPDNLQWIEQTIPVAPKKKVDMATIWDDMHASIRHNATYPITLEQAAAVMKVVSAAKKNTPFE